MSMATVTDLSRNNWLFRFGALSFSLSFLIWSLSYFIWPSLFSTSGQYQVTPLFGSQFYFANAGFLIGIILSIALTAAGITCISAWAKGRNFSGRIALMLSFLFFAAFQAVQAWEVFRTGLPLGSYFSLTGNAGIVSNGVLIDSIGIVAYLTLFSLPALVIGNTYSRVLSTAALVFSVWLYLRTLQYLYFVFSHGNLGYRYFGCLPFSPYFGGLNGLLINYKIPPYTIYTNNHIYLIISGLLFFVSYFILFVSGSLKPKSKTVA